jgi:hypothetical protein
MTVRAVARDPFLPSRHGFGFDNSWPAAPGIAIPTPCGSIGIGNAAAGLCGGMVFGALDYWHAGLPAPAQRPAAGTPLYQFIVRRLIDSWHLPAGVARYYQWMNLPAGDTLLTLHRMPLLTARGLSWRTIAKHWPRVRTSIDAGQPAALGLVTMATANPLALGHNHQVLAYRYAVAGSQVTLSVYDPNSGPADNVRIRFDTAAPARARSFDHSINIGWPVRGFFVTGYRPALPPSTG